MKSLSKRGQDLVKSFEGFSLVGYLPTPDDVPTIGWGSTKIFGRKVILGEEITEEDAQKQFEKDVVWAVNCVNNHISVDLTQNQFDALVSLCYNIGGSAFANSTLKVLLNTGDYHGAAVQFLRWNKQKGKELKGLTKRRQAEQSLFLEK